MTATASGVSSRKQSGGCDIHACSRELLLSARQTSAEGYGKLVRTQSVFLVDSCRGDDGSTSSFIEFANDDYRLSVVFRIDDVRSENR